MLTPEEMAAVDVITGLTLSKDGVWLAYCFEPVYRPGDHKTSAIWLAEPASENSAKQLTSGLFRDFNPAFHPTSSDILFLSDRHKPGGKSQIYQLKCSSPYGGDPIPLTPLANKKGVSSFAISPHGKYIAFVSADEPADKKDATGDAEVWNEKKDLGRLRIIDEDGQ